MLLLLRMDIVIYSTFAPKNEAERNYTEIPYPREIDSQFAFGLTNPLFLWATHVYFSFEKIFQICPCLPAIPAIQDTMLDSNTTPTAGEVHIFFGRSHCWVKLKRKTFLGISLKCLPTILMPSLFAYTVLAEVSEHNDCKTSGGNISI